MIARTVLSIPGNNPGMMINADLYGADIISFDLEDGVALTQKDSARILIKHFLGWKSGFKSTIAVRLNHWGTPFFSDDVKMLIPFGVILTIPKMETPKDTAFLDAVLAEEEARQGVRSGSTKYIGIIESACGLENAYDIAVSSDRIIGISLGAEDLSADLHAVRTREGYEISYGRQRLVVAARAAGLMAFDAVFPNVDDEIGLIEDAKIGRQLGFDGKTVISPRQIRHVNEAFAPSQAEIQYAEKVCRAMEEGVSQGKGAVALNGRMIDQPVYLRALQVLETARELGLRPELE